MSAKTDLNQNLAGPLAIDAALQCDSKIPEKNDGRPPNEADWIQSAETHHKEIFERQRAFFAELRARGTE